MRRFCNEMKVEGVFSLRENGSDKGGGSVGRNHKEGRNKVVFVLV